MRPSRWILVIVTGLLGLLAVCTLGACDAAPSNNTTPTNVNTQLASDLASLGYTAVGSDTLVVDGKDRNGVAFVYCKQLSAQKCGTNRHNEATAAHPNVYAIDGNVIDLEGPHVAVVDERSIMLTVPSNWRGFDRLTTAERKQLLGAMSEAVKKTDTNFNTPGNDAPQTVTLKSLDSERVDVWAYRIFD